MEKEYLMLREELLLLEKIVDNTLNYFYVFVSAILIFALNEEESLYILFSYMVIIPAYLVVVNKTNGMRKIGAYLYVFLEGKDFNWETRCKRLYEMANHKHLLSSKISSFNYPFIFVSTFVTIIFITQTNFNESNFITELPKTTLAIILYIIQIILIIINRKIKNDKYIPYWEKIKNEQPTKKSSI